MSATNKPIAAKPTLLPPPGGISDFSQEQWLDLLRMITPTSRHNLQLALRQHLDEVARIETAKAIQPLRTILPAASTLVSAPKPTAPPVPEKEPENSFGQERYMSMLRQSLDLDQKPQKANTVTVSTASVDPPNGLDTLAAAALASTNSEVSGVTFFVVVVIVFYNFKLSNTECFIYEVKVFFSKCPCQLKK